VGAGVRRQEGALGLCVDLTEPRGAWAAGGGGEGSGGGGVRERCGHGKQRGKCRECRVERAAGEAVFEEQGADEEVEERLQGLRGHEHLPA